MKHLAWLVSASLAMALPGLAKATDGYVTGNVNLRAGPDAGYPLVDQLQAGTEVDVQGCTSGWEWCDVIAYGNRGWVAGNYIEYEYQDQPVLLPVYGARIGIPIITFSIGTYWDSYYRSRPFYGRRNYWYQRSAVRRPPPPPMAHPYRGPVLRGNGPGHPPGVFHPRVGQPGHLGPVGPGHPVYRTPDSRQPQPQSHGSPQQSHAGPQPASRPTSRPVQPRREENSAHNDSQKAPPAKHDDKDHQHDR